MDRMELDDLWTKPPRLETVDPSGLPDAVRRYFQHACPAPVPSVGAVRLQMSGSMKLKNWCSFAAEQVISPSLGMIWQARTKLAGLPVSGFDRIVDGQGAMCWKILGLFPVMRTEGPDVTRSAAGRMFGELTWLPTALMSSTVTWEELGPNLIRAKSVLAGTEVNLDLEIDLDGRPCCASFDRWGNPDGAYAVGRFGVVFEEEADFGGFRIPGRLRAGWRFGSDSFESEGVFFRATIESAEFR